MKKLTILFFVVLGIFAVGFLTNCNQPSTPVTEEPTIPPTFSETLSGKFWLVDKLEKYSVTQRTAEENPYELGTCMYFGEDGFITFWVDSNDDGLLSPSEQVGGTIPWEATDEVLLIDGQSFDIAYFEATGWAIEADITGTTIGDWLGNEGEPYEGWIRIHYVPCMKGFDGDLYEGSFAFVFDDLNDVNANWQAVVDGCQVHWRSVLDLDQADGFYFTSGTPVDSYFYDDPILGVHIIIIDYHDGYGGDIDSVILIGSEEYGFEAFASEDGFYMDQVYDMYLTVDSADVATFEFVSRFDGDGFSIEARVDRSELGEFIIRAIDDCDVPVVNP